jgi:hypothetical protein
MKFIEISCQPFTENHLIGPILTFPTSPSTTTIQIAIDSNLDTRIYSQPGPQNPWAPTRLKVCFLDAHGCPKAQTVAWAQASLAMR